MRFGGAVRHSAFRDEEKAKFREKKAGNVKKCLKVDFLTKGVKATEAVERRIAETRILQSKLS